MRLHPAIVLSAILVFLLIPLALVTTNVAADANGGGGSGGHGGNGGQDSGHGTTEVIHVQVTVMVEVISQVTDTVPVLHVVQVVDQGPGFVNGVPPSLGAWSYGLVSALGIFGIGGYLYASGTIEATTSTQIPPGAIPNLQTDGDGNIGIFNAGNNNIGFFNSGTPNTQKTRVKKK